MDFTTIEIFNHCKSFVYHVQNFFKLYAARKFDFESLSEKPWRNVKIIKSANQRPVMDFSKFEESFVACMGVVLPLLKTEENEIENENEGIN